VSRTCSDRPSETRISPGIAGCSISVHGGAENGRCASTMVHDPFVHPWRITVALFSWPVHISRTRTITPDSCRYRNPPASPLGCASCVPLGAEACGTMASSVFGQCPGPRLGRGHGRFGGEGGAARDQCDHVLRSVRQPRVTGLMPAGRSCETAEVMIRVNRIDRRWLASAPLRPWVHIDNSKRSVRPRAWTRETGRKIRRAGYRSRS